MLTIQTLDAVDEIFKLLCECAAENPDSDADGERLVEAAGVVLTMGPRIAARRAHMCKLSGIASQHRELHFTTCSRGDVLPLLFCHAGEDGGRFYFNEEEVLAGLDETTRAQLLAARMQGQVGLQDVHEEEAEYNAQEPEEVRVSACLKHMSIKNYLSLCRGFTGNFKAFRFIFYKKISVFWV